MNEAIAVSERMQSAETTISPPSSVARPGCLEWMTAC
jgi:hypothetical protein